MHGLRGSMKSILLLTLILFIGCGRPPSHRTKPGDERPKLAGAMTRIASCPDTFALSERRLYTACLPDRAFDVRIMKFVPKPVPSTVDTNVLPSDGLIYEGDFWSIFEQAGLDVTGDGKTTVADIVALVRYLFIDSQPRVR